MIVDLEQSYNNAVAAVVEATNCSEAQAQKVVESISELVLATLSQFTIHVYEEDQNAVNH